MGSNDPITASYADGGTIVESFGRDGTGLKSWNFDIDWNTDQWYSFVTRAWDESAHTMFGYWVFNQDAQEWFHLVTMDFPVADVRYNSSTGSFIEDWLGNGWESREIHHKEGWKRKTSDFSWNPFISSFFERVSPDPGAANYIENFDGGVADDYYFMKSGGTVSPETNESLTTLSLSNNDADPGYAMGEIAVLNSTQLGNIVTLDWEVNSSKSPQFSYHIEIHDDPSFSGIPLIQLDEIIPHARTVDLNMSSLELGNEYYIKMHIIGQQSEPITDSFIWSVVGLDELGIDLLFSCFPNPFDDEINLRFIAKMEECKIQMTNIWGDFVFSKYNCSGSEMKFSVPNNLAKGVYFLKITDQDSRGKTIRVYQ